MSCSMENATTQQLTMSNGEKTRTKRTKQKIIEKCIKIYLNHNVDHITRPPFVTLQMLPIYLIKMCICALCNVWFGFCAIFGLFVVFSLIHSSGIPIGITLSALPPYSAFYILFILHLRSIFIHERNRFCMSHSSFSLCFSFRVLIIIIITFCFSSHLLKNNRTKA